MATYTSTSGNYKTTLTVTETATSIPNNTSTLSWSLKVERIGGASQYGIHNANQCPWSVSINGSRVGSGTFSYDFRYTGSYNLGSGNNVTVAHNNDGTKTGVAVSGTVDLDNSPYAEVMTASGTIDLTTIPRASDISLSVGSYNVTSSSGNAFTYTITAKSTSFYNRLRYTLGSTNYTGSGSTGSRSGNFTNAELLNSLPTATSGSLTAYVDTATDSGFTNIIGTNSVSIPISINTSYIKPSLTLQNLSANSSPISGYAVAGYSKVQCGTSSSKWSASGGYGSNAITVTFTTSHGSLAQSSYSASSNTISNYTVTNVLPSSSSNYTLTISATARDSRGATTSASKTYTVYGYTPPTANLTAYRVASSGSTAEDGAGTFAYVAFSGAVSSSVNSQNTLQSVSCSYSGSISGTIAGSTSQTTSRWLSLTDTQTVTFQLTVTDKVTSSTTAKTIATASYPLDLYDDGNGHVGVGLGAVAEGNYVKLGEGLFPKGRWLQTYTNSLASNLNQVTESIIAFDTNTSNRPCDYGVCYTYGYAGQGTSNSWYSQIAFGTNGIIYFRNSINSVGQTWGNWSSFYGGFNPQTTIANADNATNASNANIANATYRNIVSRIGNNYNSDFTGDRMRVYEYTSEAPNGPSAHYYHVFNIMGPNTSYATQLAIGMTTQRIYYRTYQGGNWLTWWRAELFNTIWTGTLKGGNAITLDVSGYSRLRVYANCYAVTVVYTVELTRAVQHTQISGYTYSGGGVSAEYTASGGLELLTSQSLVSSDKKTFYHYHCGYQAGSSATNKDNDSNYFVYQIDGLAY